MCSSIAAGIRRHTPDGRRAGPIVLLIRNGILLSPLWLGWLALTVDRPLP